MKLTKSKRVRYIVLFVVFLLLVCIGLHKPILIGAGRFLAPASMESGEVLILAGSQVVKNGALKVGMKLLSEGRADRMVVILLQFAEDDEVFPTQEKYIQFVINEFEHLGLKKEKVQVVSVPIDGHPITLAEARFVVARLSEDGVHSAILVSKGFHTRRSFGVYRQEGDRTGLRVVPSPYFIGFETNSWWRDTQGVIDFFQESVKLTYYLLHGYVPMKALWY